jgi:hypothetical protein
MPTYKPNYLPTYHPTNLPTYFPGPTYPLDFLPSLRRLG